MPKKRRNKNVSRLVVFIIEKFYSKYVAVENHYNIKLSIAYNEFVLEDSDNSISNFMEYINDLYNDMKGKVIE